LSNSDTPLVRELYSGALGFGLRRVEARRNVNSDAKKRGAVGELLIW
jgi:DNA adenine methylase